MHFKSWSTGFLVILLVVSTGVSKDRDEVFKRQLSLNDGGRITLKNTNGKITIQGWDQSLVDLEAIKRVQTDDDERAAQIMEKLEIEIEESGDEVYIRTRLPNENGGGFLSWIFGGHFSASVDYSLKVPQNCRLAVENTNGSIQISDFSGELKIKTTNGKIRGESLRGEMELHTTNGSIEAELSQVVANGELEFGTTNGSVNLHLPADSHFHFSGRTVNGSIKTDFPLTVEGELNRRQVDGEVNGGGIPIKASTTNGSIRLLQR